MTYNKPIMLITGTSKGIGKYLAEYFLNQGYTIIGCSRKESDLKNDNYHHYKCNLQDEQDIDNMVLNIKRTFNKIDILINNAGIAAMNHFLLTPISQAKKVMDVNYFGTFIMCQKITRLLLKSSNPRIINFSTVAVPLDLAGEAAYVGAKSAIVGLTKVLAKELSNYNITVNAIGPTPVKTDLIKKISDKKIDELIKQQAIKRLGTKEDVLNVIKFFIQPESNFITGQVIYLGGVS